MDRDEQQDDENDQVGRTRTHQVDHTDQDEDSTARPSHSSHPKREPQRNGSTSQFEDVRENADSVTRVNRTWKDELLKERVTNGKDSSRVGEEEQDLEDEFEVGSEISFLKDISGTASPSRNFKSSYAQSLADSYRRACLPVVVSSPKAQYYFKNDEFLCLNSNNVKHSGVGHSKFLSLDSGTSKTSSQPSPEALSLPTILDVVPEPQDKQGHGGKTDFDSPSVSQYNQLLVDGNVYVSYEQVCKLCEKSGDEFSLQDWHSLPSVTASDGRKLVRLSGEQKL